MEIQASPARLLLAKKASPLKGLAVWLAGAYIGFISRLGVFIDSELRNHITCGVLITTSGKEEHILIIKGIDTVEFGVEVFDYFQSLKSTLDMLALLKSKAQEESKEYEVEINGISLKVHRNGISFISR